jgi:uncharacterized membrane protein YdjX (TVP38/TMEM64 family)
MFARFRKWLGAWLTHLEYRLRVSRPFTHGSGGARVFYPGCSLTAADPALVLRAYEWLRERDPSVVLWSDCCGMPLEKFSTPAAAERGRERTRRLLRESHTTELITACGNCTVQFDSLGVEGLKLTSLYGLLAEEEWAPREDAVPSIVHHPCSARIDKAQQTHFRALADRLHLTVLNADDTKHPLSCCLVKTPAAMAKREALANSTVITYCAHCTMAFQQDVPTRHVLQEVFGTAADRWTPRGKVARFLQYRRFARLARTSAAARAPWGALALLLVVAVAVLALAARSGGLGQAALSLVSWSRGAGVIGAAAYAGAYVASTVVLLPASLLTLGAGFAWGPLVGVAIVSPVSVLAATGAFLLGRSLLRAQVERRIAGDPRFAAIDRAVGEHGLRLVLLLRLSPILPFNLLNYALALTRVSLRDYVVGSVIGMFPATVLYVYLGSLASDGAALLSGRLPASGAAGSVLYWGGLLATVLVVVQVTRMARKELRRLLGTT